MRLLSRAGGLTRCVWRGSDLSLRDVRGVPIVSLTFTSADAPTLATWGDFAFGIAAIVAVDLIALDSIAVVEPKPGGERFPLLSISSASAVSAWFSVRVRARVRARVRVRVRT